MVKKTNAAFIPVRGGSKSIPLKNIKPINGRPLVYWTLKAACGCGYIDKVYVATDSDEIRDVVDSLKKSPEWRSFEKAEVIGRSAESASDTASTESAMLEFAQEYDFDNIVLIQATSPLLQSYDLDRGFEAFEEEGVDSVLSAVRQKRFNWSVDDKGYAHPENYDVFKRPRRQEFDGYLVENGAFYITSKKDLLASRNRVSGNMKAVEMNEDTFFEIDEPSDWVIIEALMKKNGIKAPLDIPRVKMFLTDCDGCLTDGGMYYSENGDELKKFSARDGKGFALLREAGIVTGIITGETVDLNRRRAEKLKMDILETGCGGRKLEVVKGLCRERDIDLSEVCYVGDDVMDLEVIKAAGFGCCPADAVKAVRDAADYVSPVPGGRGAIRDIVDLILNSGAELN